MGRRGVVTLVLAALVIGFVPAARAQEAGKPLGLPLAMPAGPSSWLMGQPYGNTTGAYNFGTEWYSAGQGLHFGIDLSMPCGTPVVATADGEVIYADNMAFGAGPHNLILRHPEAGVTTLYGHLLDAPPVQQFQPVQKGQVVGYSGDPDVTCDSRPHLHFEVRSLDYRTAYNPIAYIDAPWHVLAGIGSFNQTMFAQDLMNPRRWMSLDDQPDVAFGGVRLNAYGAVWPPPGDQRPPNSARPLRVFEPLPEGTLTLQPLTGGACCATAWWHPTDSNRLYTIDGAENQPAGIFEWDVAARQMIGVLGQAPPSYTSPDGQIQIHKAGDVVTLQRVADGTSWTVPTNGFMPAVSSDNSRLMWQVQYAQFVPGTTPPDVAIWVSGLDGANARQLMFGPRMSASWLDGARLLISQTERTQTTLSVYDTRDDSSFTLGTWERLRGLSIAPGGERALFYQSFQSDPAVNGMYALEIQPGAVPTKLPWFGGWRWRDAESVYYIPFEPENPAQTFAYYHIPTGETRLLTDPAVTPFTVANGDWSVSPDGRRIVFQNAADMNLWLAEVLAG